MNNLPESVRRQIEEADRATREAIKAGVITSGITEENMVISGRGLPTAEAVEQQDPPKVEEPEQPDPAVEEPDDTQDNDPGAHVETLDLQETASPGRSDEVAKWEHRYRTLEGKYRAEITKERARSSALQGQIDELRRQFDETRNELRARPAPVETPAPETRKRYVTPAEEEESGALLDLIARRAREVAEETIAQERVRLMGEVGAVRAQVGNVQKTAAELRKEALERALDTALPEWRQFDNDEHFGAWLSEPDVYSGIARRVLLTNAISSSDTRRVVAIYRGYHDEQKAVAQPEPEETAPPRKPTARMETMVAPGAGRSTATSKSAAPGLLSQDEIAAFDKAVKAGQYRGRPAEVRQMEDRIAKTLLATAQAQARVMNGRA